MFRPVIANPALSRSAGGSVHRQPDDVPREESRLTHLPVDSQDKHALRVVGRGGWGSKLRIGSISIPASAPSTPVSAATLPFSPVAGPSAGPRVSPPIPSSPSTPSISQASQRASSASRVAGRLRAIKSSRTPSDGRSISSSAPSDDVSVNQPPGTPLLIIPRRGAGLKPRFKSPVQISKTFVGMRTKLGGKGRADLSASPPSSFDGLDSASVDSWATDDHSMVSSIHFAPLPSKGAESRKPPNARNYNPFAKLREGDAQAPSTMNTEPCPVPTQTPSFFNFPHPDDPLSPTSAEVARSNSKRIGKLAKTLGAGVPAQLNLNHASKAKIDQRHTPNVALLRTVPTTSSSGTTDEIGNHLLPFLPRPRVYSDPGTPAGAEHFQHQDLTPRNSNRSSKVSCLMDSLGPDAPCPPSPMMFADPPSPPLSESGEHCQAEMAPVSLTPPSLSPSPSRTSFDTQETLLEEDEDEDEEDVQVLGETDHSTFASDTNDDEVIKLEEDEVKLVTPTVPVLPGFPTYEEHFSGPKIVIRPSLPPTSPCPGSPLSDCASQPGLEHHFRPLLRQEPRHGVEFKGEWNQDTLTDVISKLRSLR